MVDQTNEFISQLDSAVRQSLEDKDPAPDEQEVMEQYGYFFDAFAGLPGYSTDGLNRVEVIEALTKGYCSQLVITKRLGFAFHSEDVKPWLRDAEEEIQKQDGWFYWKRYKSYLLRKKKWSKAAVRSIEKDTYAELDLMANPRLEGAFERRGLVVASVQSGKTANYIGLICRAADAGYKIIIVMAGVHNVLRNQTQARLEEGFTGFNIVGHTTEKVGVGKLDDSRRPVACTSREVDFSKQRANALRGFQTTTTNDPWLFVIKKNSNSLKQVCEWLKDPNIANPNDQLLLIDDEADNASINVKYRKDRRDDEPTRINGQIRSILNHFTRKCYVGYTATPYANILIDPNVDNDKYQKDLFPRDFIYTLEESSDYFGASKVFADYDSPSPKYLRCIDDIDSFLPPKHKSSFEVEGIPNSLKEAVRTFVLATTIRALAGDADEHSTMMVNVSPYKRPQKSVAWALEDYLGSLTKSIKAYSALDPESALAASNDLVFLHGTWTSEYAGNVPEYTWEQIQPALYSTIKSMRVVSINTDSNDRLEYGEHTEHVIAVGGYRLSRGLTLEGLVVSYYSRNAKAYDALMQMARWFGYRPGYERLCRIWMSDQSAGWYKFVADSTTDLFDDLRNMRQVQQTPQNYGLKIRQSPDSLIVTARNKMGTGTKAKAQMDCNNGFFETVSFNRSVEAIENNKQVTEDLLRDISKYQIASSNAGKLYHGAPYESVTNYLSRFINEDPRFPKSSTVLILNYIEGRLIDSELQEWDVFVASGSGDPIISPSIGEIKSEIRYPGTQSTDEYLVVGEKHRLASRGVESVGLSEEEKTSAEALFRHDHPDKTNMSDYYYRRKRKLPLLVIHVVEMKFTKKKKEEGMASGRDYPAIPGYNSWEHSETVYGWSISFPYTSKQAKPVDYIYNQVALDSIDNDYDEDTDEEDDDE